MEQPENNQSGNPIRRLAAKFAGTGLKTRLLNPYDTFWDLRLGVNTLGYVPAVGDDSDPNYQVHYQPTAYAKLFKVLRRLEIGPDDSFLDLGCGLGRPVFAASHLGAKRSVGVEIDRDLVAAAQRNLNGSRLRGRNIEFIAAPAQEFSPTAITAIYMFHPFGPGTLQTFADALVSSIAMSPRRVRIAYENPVHGEVLDRAPAFRLIEEWPAGLVKSSAYAVQFWECGQ